MPAYVLRVLLTWPERIVIAVVLFAAGAGLAFPALRGFRAAGTHVEPWKPASALVTDGIFSWLRNPMYVGLTLFLAGVAGARLRLDAGDDDRFCAGASISAWSSARSAISKRNSATPTAQYKARVRRYGMAVELRIIQDFPAIVHLRGATLLL